MKFAAVAALALTAASVADAQTIASCPLAVARPWILSTADPGKACFDATGFKGSGYATPTQEVATTFCQAPACRTMLDAVLAAKPAEGDCTVKQNGVTINLYATVISVFVDVCAKVTPPTTAPPPVTTAPVTTAPPPATTTPAPTTAKPTDTPTTKPVPTTARPQC